MASRLPFPDGHNGTHVRSAREGNLYQKVKSKRLVDPCLKCTQKTQSEKGHVDVYGSFVLITQS